MQFFKFNIYTICYIPTNLEYQQAIYLKDIFSIEYILKNKLGNSLAVQWLGHFHYRETQVQSLVRELSDTAQKKKKNDKKE